jgi:hypothetical protein
MSRRGRVVPGTSAKKNRLERRHARREADQLHRAGITPPATVVPPDDLAEVARRYREQEPPRV